MMVSQYLTIFETQRVQSLATLQPSKPNLLDGKY